MFQNNLKFAFRNLRRNKALSGIQIIGLAVAIATATLLCLTAMYELSFDNFHIEKEKIGLLYLKSQPENGVHYNASMPAPLAPLIKAEISDVALVSRYHNGSVVLRYKDKQFQSNNKYVDADFLSIFSFPLVEGNLNGLDQPDLMVIDEPMAQNLFGHTDVIGSSVEVNIGGDWQNKIIGAVVEKLPSNSDFNFQSLMRFEQKPDYALYKDDWSHVDHNVYVKLNVSKVEDKKFSRTAQSFVDLHLESDLKLLKRDGANVDENGNYLSLHALPLSQHHLNNYGLGNGGSSTFPWILLLVSAVILFIACSNFINLSLASSLSRNKEIGTRKTLGSTTWRLVNQLWTEALLVCVVALFLGLLLALTALKHYNAIMNYKLSIMELLAPINLLLFLAGFFVLTLFAGGYPAWRIAKQNTVQTLKGSATLKSGFLRNGLTVLQFSIAMVLIVGTIVVGSQLHYLNTRPLGFNKSEVISIPIGAGIDPEQALQQMRNELQSQPWVESVSASDINLGRGRDGSMSNSVFGFTHNEKQIYTNFMRVDYDYLETLGIKLIAGRDFNRQFSTDNTAVIINKKMAEQLGGVDQALNMEVELEGNITVIGIIDDFHFQDLRQPVKSLTMSINPEIFPVDYIFARVRSGNLTESLAKVETIWKKVHPQAKASPSFLDENTERLYQNEKRMSTIVISAAIIAIVISCMGLFALALLSINRRIKEIGIRKVLGSSVAHIVLLLSKDYIKLVAIAFALAAPLAWWIMTEWLQNFAFHIELQWWMLFLAGTATLVIAWLTVSIKAVQAARANPVESLRDE